MIYNYKIYIYIIYNSHIDRARRFNTSFRREFCRKRSARLRVYCFGIIVGAVRTFRRRAACLKNRKSNTINLSFPSPHSNKLSFHRHNLSIRPWMIWKSRIYLYTYTHFFQPKLGGEIYIYIISHAINDFPSNNFNKHAFSERHRLTKFINWTCVRLYLIKTPKL